MQWTVWLFVALFFAGPPAASAEYNTVDELAKAYSVEQCKSCHGKVHGEWQSSYHSQSIVHSLGGMRNYIVAGLGQEWKKPVTRENLMRCMECHAPLLRDASEALAKVVANLIVGAVDDKDEAKKASAKKELAKLNVNCIVCHNMKIGVEKGLRGAPVPGVYYGPTGKSSPAHRTEKSPAITSAVFCGQCHGIVGAPDGEWMVCNTLYGSYQDAYRGNGGTETCQDCHMKAKNRGHRFPGAYDAEILQDGIGLDIQAVGVKLTPGKWVPTAIVNIGLRNQAGHRIPDG
jgi:hypothetical protein